MTAVSACLAGFRCRYDGQSAFDLQVMEQVRCGHALPVCPEQLGGLPTPRCAAEIVTGDGVDVWRGQAKVMNKEGEDITPYFIRGAKETLWLCQSYNVQEAWLKARSPSCGVHCIYDGSFLGCRREGPGVTAALLKAHGFRLREIE